jgi:hypothetical protein
MVGVDGAPDSETVLEWAAVMGEHLNLPVVAVTTTDESARRADPTVIDDGSMVLDPVLRIEGFRSGEAARGDLGGLGDRRLRIIASVRSRHPRADIAHVRARGELAGALSGMAGEADFIVVAEPAGSAGRSTSLSSYYRRYARSAVLIPPFDELRSLAEAHESGPVIEGTLVEVRKDEPSGKSGVLASLSMESGGAGWGQPSHWFG